MPTEHGSAVFKGRQPAEDAACVTALRRPGAIVLGKTVTTELATHTPSRTRNPGRIAEHTPGGSSSGSAAAVAAGMVPVAVGTQTGGSVIRPAAFCGVYGFKPTFGVIPRTGVLTQSPSLDTLGVFGRSVEDLALTGGRAAGLRRRDPASLSHQPAAACSRPPRRTGRCRRCFAFVKTHAWNDTDAVTREAFGELVEALGSQVTEIIIDSTTEDGSRPPANGAGLSSWRITMARYSTARPTGEQGAWRTDRGRAAHQRRRLFGGAGGSRAVLATRSRVVHRLRHDPDARCPGPGAEGSQYHRQPGVLRVLDLPRRAGRDAAAAGGGRHALGCTAHRPAPRRRPPAARCAAGFESMVQEAA